MNTRPKWLAGAVLLLVLLAVKMLPRRLQQLSNERRLVLR